VDSLFVRAVAGAFVAAACVFALPVLLGSLGRSSKALQACAIGFTVFVVDIVCVYLPTLFGAAGLTWAWLGKLTELALFLFLARALAPAREGLNSPTWKALLTAAAVAAATLLPGLVTVSASPPWPTAAYLAYQATMPGLAEELIYRGLLLGVLDEALGRPWRLLGVRWGWGAVITTALFFFGHTLAFDEAWHLTVDFAPVLDFAFFSLAMCWLRYRFDNVWSCVVAHNLANCLQPYLVIAVVAALR
jgi:hypothetical protein